MGFWDSKEKETDNVQPDKETEIRRMSNISNLESAINSAPASTASDVVIPANVSPAKKSRPSKINQQPITTQTSQQTADAIKLAEQLAKRKAALQKIGAKTLEKAANAPYDFWAMLADDNELKLSSEERKELAEAYQLIGEALPLGELPPWITLSLYMAGMHGDLIRTRLQHIKERQDKMAIDIIEKGKEIKS
jgi:hypothetical protein